MRWPAPTSRERAGPARIRHSPCGASRSSDAWTRRGSRPSWHGRSASFTAPGAAMPAGSARSRRPPEAVMFVFTILYLLLVLIRPQDYPELQAEGMLPWQQLALLGAGLFWLASSRKNLSTPQHMLLLAFLPLLMLSSIANGWMGGALVQLEKFGPVVLAFC